MLDTDRARSGHFCHAAEAWCTGETMLWGGENKKFEVAGVVLTIERFGNRGVLSCAQLGLGVGSRSR